MTETSTEAYESIQDAMPYLQHQVLKAIRAAGLAGLTSDEVELRTGLPHQTASARVNELHHAGQIRRSGVKRPTRSGRRAWVYVAA